MDSRLNKKVIYVRVWKEEKKWKILIFNFKSKNDIKWLITAQKIRAVMSKTC